jgi:hypothetical protein
MWSSASHTECRCDLLHRNLAEIVAGSERENTSPRLGCRASDVCADLARRRSPRTLTSMLALV